MKSKASFLLPLLAVSSGLVYIQAAHAQPISEPKWPQAFEAAQGKPAVFTFPITQPGPVSVSVQSGAAPVLVTLFGPVPRPIQKGGTGNVQIAYAATTADVHNRYLWSVHIDSPSAAVQGSISVSHPPAEMNLVIPYAQKLLQHNAQVAANRAGNAAKVQQALAVHEQTRQEARQRLAAAQAQKTQRLLNSIGARPGLQTRGLQPAPGTIVPGTIVAQGPMITPAPAPRPAPVISDVSPREGQPGDPILITGSNFGSTGQVHFVVNPGMNLIAPVDHWSDTQIVAHVPDASGIQRYLGYVYVIVPPPTQPPLPQRVQQFTFDPQLDSTQLCPSQTLADRNVAPMDDGCRYAYTCYGRGFSWVCWNTYEWCSTTHMDDGTHDSGNDEWYLTTNLKNGWVVKSPSVSLIYSDGHEEATIADYRPGTPSLYTKVHWRQDPGADTGYLLVITINGPKGTDPGVRTGLFNTCL